MLMSAYLLRFKANYLEKMRGYPHFSLWFPIAFAKSYFFRTVPKMRKLGLLLFMRTLSAHHAMHRLRDT